jgi:hypothetical protein
MDNGYMTKTTSEQTEQEVRARLDAYCTSDATKARFAEQAKWLSENMPAGSRDSSGNSVETLIGALRRASNS